MPASVVMLRGINLGRSNRVAMGALRDALTGAGLANPRTYVQSGNVIVDTELCEGDLVGRVREAVCGLGLDVPVVVRSGAELAAVVAANPFAAEAATSPKLMQVTFREAVVDDATLAALRTRTTGGERIAAAGRELYTWHPDGIARSKLATALTGRPAAAATARNWTTVLALCELAGVPVGTGR